MKYDKWDIGGGAGLVIIGIVVSIIGSGYRLGTFWQLGPGALPVVLGLALAAFGIAITVQGLRTTPGAETKFEFRPIVAIVLGMLFWALLLRRAGLVPATVGLIVISSFAVPRPKLVTVAVWAVVVSVLGVLVFIWGLRMTITPFHW
jgi:hypothetical protein